MLGPAQQHLGASLGDVVVAEVASVYASGVDVVARWRGVGFVEDLFLGPWVIYDLLDVVGDRRGGGGMVIVGVWRHDGAGSLEVAVVEGVIRVWGDIDHDESLVAWGVEEIKVHHWLFDQEGGCCGWQLIRCPGIAGPVFVLEKASFSSGA